MSKTKIQEIDEKIAKLMEAKKSLSEKQEREFTKLITKMGLSSLEKEILVGALLHIKQKCEKDINQKEAWKAAGKTFLAKKQSPTSKPKDEKNHHAA